jgi:hypothetical protein
MEQPMENEISVYIIKLCLVSHGEKKAIWDLLEVTCKFDPKNRDQNIKSTHQLTIFPKKSLKRIQNSFGDYRQNLFPKAPKQLDRH